ncbi:peptidyl-trna hydrolase ptrhd1 [Tubulinosema ratisbonensis]|uniref:peptidyl-tRNA hydrolase n=1 Tax=Tubulinosema ratisbonensis TaxID=291195 RepID=A0A437AKU9_9MICR|nr:peptidyl-trna hydrolase ptrhd1 [Tubulinosema ratisbonensis]
MLKHFIFVRNDINLNTGALLAQVSHVSIKCVLEFLSDPDCYTFINQTDMTTIILQVNEDEYCELKEYLSSNSQVSFVEWLEQPENVMTALAVKPLEIEKEKEFMKFIKKYKLFK